MNRTINILGLLAMFCVAIALPGMAATTSVEADSWVAADLDGSASVWISADNFLVVSFGSGIGQPAHAAVTMIANSSGADNEFRGDFKEAGVKSLRMRMRSEADVSKPIGAMLVLRGLSSGRLWRNENLQVSTSAGLWVTNTLSLERSSGWTWDGPGDLDALWNDDIQDVALVGLRVDRGGDEGKTYSIDNFVLLDVDGSVSGEADLVPTRVTDFFASSYGVANVADITEEMKNTDSDNDGMSDWDETWAGTNPQDAESVFAAEIAEEESASEGVLLKWPCVTGGRYAVMRATDLISGFSTIAVSLTPTPEEAQAGSMTFDDVTATGVGPYFYKILKQ